MTDSIITSLGLGSGLNVSQLVRDLAAASRAPKAERFDALAKASQAKISAVAQARADLDSFADTLGDLVATGSLASRPLVSDERMMQASALPGAQLGALSVEIEVRQLARSQTTHSALMASASTPIGTGTIDLTVAGQSYPVTINAANNSLAGLVDAINASGSGVRATVVADQGQVRLVLKGEAGSAKAFAVNANAASSTELASLVNSGLTVSQAASDAMIRVDGVEFRRPSNRIADVVPGVALSLKTAEAGTIVNLSASRPTDALRQTISDFVSVFNQLQASLKSARQTVGGGDLRALDRELTGLIGQPLTSHATVNSLSDIGIALDRSGGIIVDAARLDAILASAPDAVEALFNPQRNALQTAETDPGLAGALDAIRDRAAASGGVLDSLGKRLQAESAELAKNRARMEAREAAYEARLQRQYATLDARVGAFKATQSYLDQQIKLWSNER